ncbi:MAG: hypothetical protein K0S39_4702 [Paenibacillus sp.]|jgi:choline dehydrogenase-like flavoprotein|nr:hypothetical protein [Paenibacillus sp.]
MAEQDVIVIGAGGGGAVIAKELGEMGLKVLVLEAGPWYGNKQWPNPNLQRGAQSSSDPEDLDVRLFKKFYNKQENVMNDLISGRVRWGPADSSRPLWGRLFSQKGFVWQGSGVGGSTQHYLGHSPRAFPIAVDHVWPISYRELIPYYEKVEATLPVEFAPVTSKEELFYYGVKKAGWQLIPTLDVVSPGYRPQPNAILPPNNKLMDPNYSLEQLSWMEGCTLAGHCINGCPHGPTVDKIAKRSTNVSYVPLALKTGNVRIRPNAFTVKVFTEHHPAEGLRATGVQIRDTWTGETEVLRAEAVVMAAGSIESPRLWLNSDLPHNPWVGRGLVNHYMDWVTGIFDGEDLLPVLGKTEIDPFIGHTSGARLDYPGKGALQVTGLSPGLTSALSYGLSESGYNMLQPPGPGMPWDAQGIIVGPRLQQLMADYRRTLNITIYADDVVDWRNGITVEPSVRDEHGPVPRITYRASQKSQNNRDFLVKIAVDILRQAGAKQIIRANWPAGLMIHLESSMRMGYVVDTDCEAYQVKRLFIADNSVHYNGLGGANPTLSTQALATRTAEKLFEKYFS